jgi:hypothetical protein
VMDLAFVVATVWRRSVRDGEKMGASARISVGVGLGAGVVLGMAVVSEQRR